MRVADIAGPPNFKALDSTLYLPYKNVPVIVASVKAVVTGITIDGSKELN